MLKRLFISNIILIESASLDLDSGLNILSGETGSGKSAIMNALSLLAGDKAESSIIRKGCEKGTVEGLFEIDTLDTVKNLLLQSGLEHEPGEELIIRREVNSSGKSRSFINNQTVQAGLLREIGEELINISGQHANRWLLSIEKHREILDLFGDLKEFTAEFAKSWLKENAVRKELETLISEEAQRIRTIEICRMELAEIEKAQLKEGEDEELFNEYTLLISAEERVSRANEIVQSLTGEKASVLSSLNRQKHIFDQLIQLDSDLSETAKIFENCQIELQEIAYTMQHYLARIDHNPSRTAEVNERMTLITRLKRKYGTTLNEIEAYHNTLEEKLNQLENSDLRIEQLQKQLQELENSNTVLCQEITKKRQTAGKLFAQEMVFLLRSLNMAKVEFHVAIVPQKRTAKGDESVEFFLTPNVGEHKISIRDCASGGELSRLMLATQTLLSGKGQTPVLIFDEIDANIGGETATVVGHQLKRIGNSCQVLCVTHFPQVAMQADRHYQISKKEENGRTITSVFLLEGSDREKELKRMLGGSFKTELTTLV